MAGVVYARNDSPIELDARRTRRPSAGDQRTGSEADPVVDLVDDAADKLLQ